ncbi:MAG: hypothetical protein ACI8ZM_000533 [Crocinitomix sp.]|jgi:hypothetical protein
MNLSTATIWHEFGHLFSYKLIQKIVDKPIKIIELNLIRDKSKNPYIKSDCIDFIRLKNENWDEFKKRLNKNFLNNRFYYQITIKIMGAVFQIENQIDRPTIDDFCEIFTDFNGEVSDDNIIGHAGIDFLEIKSYLFDYNSSLTYINVKKFALNLHSILDNQNIFTLLNKHIDYFN